jgi:hypothetical protein
MKPSLSRVLPVVAYSKRLVVLDRGRRGRWAVAGGLSGGRVGGGVDRFWGAAVPRRWLEGLIRVHRPVVCTEEVGGFGVGCWVERRREGDRPSRGPDRPGHSAPRWWRSVPSCRSLQ